jgi:4'-phosphopantetheinyl transferase
MEASLRYGVHPADVQIGFHEKGKPFFSDFPDFRFNITHGGNIVAVAFCEDNEVGIDVEAADRRVNLEIAERHFTAAEANYIRNTPPEQRPLAFLRLWTIKEAYLKMIGTGLSKPLDSFEIQYDKGKIKIYDHKILQDCTVFQDETDEKHIITVCVKGGENNFRFTRQDIADIITFVEKNKR